MEPLALSYQQKKTKKNWRLNIYFCFHFWKKISNDPFDLQHKQNFEFMVKVFRKYFPAKILQLYPSIFASLSLFPSLILHTHTHTTHTHPHTSTPTHIHTHTPTHPHTNTPTHQHTHKKCMSPPVLNQVFRQTSCVKVGPIFVNLSFSILDNFLISFLLSKTFV